MDFQLKQWREQQQQQQQHESEQEQQPPSAKQPRLLFETNPSSSSSSYEASALPLLSNLSAYSSDSTLTAATKNSRMGSYFSLAQWQELELQALIYRHMLAGAPIPHELLHLIKKSLIATSPYYLPHPLQNYPYYQQSLIQSGYWGRGAMDPEPGRCRRTDGKKWRCSRDVVAGGKYCERHMHRGRNRSRKPVEIPTPTNQTGGNAGGNGRNGDGSGGGGGSGAIVKTSNPLMAHPLAAMSSGGGGGDGGGGTPHFTLSGHSPSIDLLHLSQRSSEQIITNNDPFETQNDVSGDGKSGGRILRHFFDDVPGSHANSVTSATNLSISTPGNPSSDFSLKLATGNGDAADHHLGGGDVEPDLNLSHWVGALWGTNQVASTGGPLAEALRSSTSNSSPTSVLNQLSRGTTSEASFAST